MPENSSQVSYIAKLKIEKIEHKPHIPGRYPDNPPQQEERWITTELGSTTIRASDIDSLRAKVNGFAALTDED